MSHACPLLNHHKCSNCEHLYKTETNSLLSQCVKYWAPACVTSTTSVSIRIAFHESKKFLMAPWGDCAVTTLRTWGCWESRVHCLADWIPRLDLASGIHSESSLACAGTADLTSRHGWRWVVQVNQFESDRFLPFSVEVFLLPRATCYPVFKALSKLRSRNPRTFIVEEARGSCESWHERIS